MWGLFNNVHVAQNCCREDETIRTQYTHKNCGGPNTEFITNFKDTVPSSTRCPSLSLVHTETSSQRYRTVTVNCYTELQTSTFNWNRICGEAKHLKAKPMTACKLIYTTWHHLPNPGPHLAHFVLLFAQQRENTRFLINSGVSLIKSSDPVLHWELNQKICDTLQ